MECTGLSERSRCLGRLVTGPPLLLRFPTLLLCLPNQARGSSEFGFDDTIGPMSSESERDVDGDDEMEMRSEVSEIRSRSNFGASVPNGSSIGRSKRYKGSEMGKVDEKFDDASSSMSWGNAGTGVGQECNR